MRGGRGRLRQLDQYEPHNGESGIPMPSRLADERELRALVGALGEGGRGVLMLTQAARLRSIP